MTSSAGAQGVLRQAQTGSPAQSRKMFPRATFLFRRLDALRDPKAKLLRAALLKNK